MSKLADVLADLAAHGMATDDDEIVLGRTQWRTAEGTPPTLTIGDLRRMAGPEGSDDVWLRIGADPELKRARQKLSMHELRLIIRHAWAAPPKSKAAAETPLRIREGGNG